MTRQKVTTIVGAVLLLVCLARPGLAQTQTPDTHAVRARTVCRRDGPAGDEPVLQRLVDAGAAKQQLDRHALGHEKQVQSNLLFQPLMSLSLNKDWGLYIRPVADNRSIPSPSSMRVGTADGPLGSAIRSSALPRHIARSRGAARDWRRPDVHLSDGVRA